MCRRCPRRMPAFHLQAIYRTAWRRRSFAAYAENLAPPAPTDAASRRPEAVCCCARLDLPWTFDSRLVIPFAVLLLSLTFHEAAHAWSADILGDPTARRLGRVSLNPIVHIDPIGTIVVPAPGDDDERAAARVGEAGPGESAQPAWSLAAQIHADCGRRTGKQSRAGGHRRPRPAPDRLRGRIEPRPRRRSFSSSRHHGRHQRRSWRSSTCCPCRRSTAATSWPACCAAGASQTVQQHASVRHDHPLRPAADGVPCGGSSTPSRTLILRGLLSS